MFLFFFFLANLLPAQKTVKKSIINPEIEAITFDVSNIFELSIDTGPGNEMALEARIDGEYSKNLLVNVGQSGNTLLVSTDFQPNFKNPNDKLSAHKVISIALKVVLPEQKRVTIFGMGCNVTAKGKYTDLKITLNDGSCFLENVHGTVDVASQSGNIAVAVSRAAITANTKYGKIERIQIPSGGTIYNLSSITGDILLKKME